MKKEIDKMYEKNALNNFKDVLGKYCAINQFIELSKRCFVVELSHYSFNSHRFKEQDNC